MPQRPRCRKSDARAPIRWEHLGTARLPTATPVAAVTEARQQQAGTPPLAGWRTGHCAKDDLLVEFAAPSPEGLAIAVLRVERRLAATLGRTSPAMAG